MTSSKINWTPGPASRATTPLRRRFTSGCVVHPPKTSWDKPPPIPSSASHASESHCAGAVELTALLVYAHKPLYPSPGLFLFLTGVPRGGGDHRTKDKGLQTWDGQRHGQQLPHRMHILQRIPPNAGTQNYLSGAFHTPGTGRGEGCSLELSWLPGGVVGPCAASRHVIPFIDNLEWRGYTEPGLWFLVGEGDLPHSSFCGKSGYRIQGGDRSCRGLDDPRESLD